MRFGPFRKENLDIRSMLVKIFLYIILIFLLYFPLVGIVSSSILLFLIPGLCVVSHFLNNKKWDWFEVLIVSLILGFCIQPIIGYALSMLGIRFLQSNVLLIISLIFLILTKNLKFKFPENIGIPILLIVLFFVNFIIFSTPTYKIGIIALEDVGPFPPGDDSKFHVMLIKEILSNKMVPNKFSLYPGIRRIRYPLGFHINISEILSLTNTDMFHLMFFSGPFLASLFSLSCYVFGKKMFDERMGLICTFLSFAILPILKFVTFGMYSNLLGVVIQPLSILFIYFFVKNKDKALAPIFLTGLFEINLYPFLINSLLALALILWYRKKITMIILISLALSLPYLSILFSPVYFSSPSSACLTFNDLQKLGLKYSLFTEKIEYFFYSNQHLLMNAGLAILAVLGVSYLTNLRKKILVTWIVVIFLIIAKRYIPIPTANNYLWYFFNSFWFWLEDQRLFYHLWIPIVFLASIFIHKEAKTKLATFFILLILIIPAFAIKLVRPSELRYQSFTKGDLEYIEWIDKNIPKDSIIYNDGFSGTTSTWIPPLANIKISFPFLAPDVGYSILKGGYIEKMKVVRQVPDSPQAINVLRNYNASYVTFSTFFTQADWFGRELPPFSLDKFVEPCYTKLYGAHENWVFKVNHDCPKDNYINLLTYDLVTENIVVINETDVRRIGPIKNETGENIEYLLNQNILFDLDNIFVEPDVIRDSEIFLFVYYEADKIGNTTASIVYGVEDKYNFIRYDLFQFKSCEDLIAVVSVPSEFVLEKDPVVWFNGDPMTVKKATVFLRIPKIEKISKGVYLQGDWTKVDDTFIIPDGSLNSRIVIQLEKPSKVVIEYMDSGFGNVDMNYYNNTWESFGTIERKGSGKTKIQQLHINSTALLFGVNIYPHQENFEIKNVYII